MKYFVYALALLAYGTPGFAQEENVLQQLLKGTDDSLLQEVLRHPEQFQLQVIYTQINRDADNTPSPAEQESPALPYSRARQNQSPRLPGEWRC